MNLDCYCKWRYVWHGFGRRDDGWMQERTPAITAHAHDCPIPEHAALAALLNPKPARDAHYAAMRDRANDAREAAGLPREDEPR